MAISRNKGTQYRAQWTTLLCSVTLTFLQLSSNIPLQRPGMTHENVDEWCMQLGSPKKMNPESKFEKTLLGGGRELQKP